MDTIRCAKRVQDFFHSQYSLTLKGRTTKFQRKDLDQLIRLSSVVLSPTRLQPCKFLLRLYSVTFRFIFGFYFFVPWFFAAVYCRSPNLLTRLLSWACILLV